MKDENGLSEMTTETCLNTNQLEDELDRLVTLAGYASNAQTATYLLDRDDSSKWSNKKWWAT